MVWHYSYVCPSICKCWNGLFLNSYLYFLISFFGNLPHFFPLDSINFSCILSMLMSRALDCVDCLCILVAIMCWIWSFTIFWVWCLAFTFYLVYIFPLVFLSLRPLKMSFLVAVEAFWSLSWAVCSTFAIFWKAVTTLWFCGVSCTSHIFVVCFFNLLVVCLFHLPGLFLCCVQLLLIDVHFKKYFAGFVM